MDFTKLENIIFTAAAGALALFLLVMTFVVIAKGRRKTSGLDIFLRIFASLVIVIGAGLFALSLFTGFTGDFRIDVMGDSAVFVIGESVTELPLGVVFATLATTVGMIISVALLAVALFALITDCLLAKKKYGAKKKAPTKSIEDLKRDVDIARIKRLGDIVIQKTSSAVNSADKTSESKKKKDGDKKSADKKEEPVIEEEKSFDWRVDEPPKKQEFVGIHDTDEGDSFDNFDSFDDFGAGESENPDNFGGEQEPEKSDASEEHVDMPDTVPEQEQAQEQETPWYEQDNVDESILEEPLSDEEAPDEELVEDEFDGEASEPQPEEQEYQDPAEEISDEIPAQEQEQETPWYEQDNVDESILEEQQIAEQEPEPVVSEPTADESESMYQEPELEEQQVSDEAFRAQEEDVKPEEQEEYAYSETPLYADEQAPVEPKQEQAYEPSYEAVREEKPQSEQPPAYEPQSEPVREERHDTNGDYSHTGADGGYAHYIEPDRNIYIPGIRVVNRAPRTTKPVEEKPVEKTIAPSPAPTAKKSAAKKPATKKPTAKKSAEPKSATKKPAAKSTAAKSTVEKPTARPQKTARPAARSGATETNLPVNKRYVILDRTNAVNMFSKYLKERETAEKVKLESSINTIIIK